MPTCPCIDSCTVKVTENIHKAFCKTILFKRYHLCNIYLQYEINNNKNREKRYPMDW